MMEEERSPEQISVDELDEIRDSEHLLQLGINHTNSRLENWQSVVLRGIQDSAIPSFRRRLITPSRQSALSQDFTNSTPPHRPLPGSSGREGQSTWNGGAEGPGSGLAQNSDPSAAQAENTPSEGVGLTADAQLDEELRRDADRLLRRMRHILPFILLLILKLLFDHLIGILFYAGATSLFLKVDTRFRQQVALKRNSSRAHLILEIVLVLSALLFYAIPLYLEDSSFLWRFVFVTQVHAPSDGSVFVTKLRPEESLLDVVWIVAANDLLVRYVTIMFKSVVWMLPCWCFLNRTSSPAAEVDDGLEEAYFLAVDGHKRKILGLVEMSFMIYRSVLPLPVWAAYYKSGGLNPDIFGILYLGLKMFLISTRLKQLLKGITSYRSGELEYGVYATQEELLEAGNNCSICFESMIKAVKLGCQHLFCENCVGEWLEKENTCPICRSEVQRDNSIPSVYRDGGTPWYPMLF